MSFQEAKPQWIKKMLGKMTDLQIILYIRIKGGGIRGLQEIHQREIREAGESKEEGTSGTE